MKKIFFLIFGILLIFGSFYLFKNKEEKNLNFVTIADKEFYPKVINLISDIQTYHVGKIGQIAVFDIGFTQEQRDNLNNMSYVKVYDLEKVNPYQFIKYKTNNLGKVVRGWFSFKPIALKQASELFNDFLYIDGGLRLKSSIEPLYQILRKKGYLFIDGGSRLWEITSQSIVMKMKLFEDERKKILNRFGMSAGMQGITREVYSNYVYPLYKYAHDIEYFVDDGTALLGFGFSRHDQTISSIQARLNNLKITKALPIHKKRKIVIEKYIAFSKR